ncbi:TPA: hypothetical protein DEW47_02870 [Patescibacteria group bacterium]|nr:hypothetical protein [Patescibacteria group bacterium]HCI04894.1 hypothetical protein [Patescibacteria group bacterium]
MPENFKRKIENFVCENCGTNVVGDGYTNHCFKCLRSKHMDNVPGDRAAGCGGLMRPMKAELKSGEYIITHKCEACGHEKRNKSSPQDDFDELMKIS